ncbi:integrase family protein [Vibrio mediterranei]|uniref:tyrosine-type recombinase/integrase n=1 Tax=Vibrio mediterranei TaxID=689 RepID=UPI0017BBC3BC|nr:integrase family protein [Vibrio mediterranei]NUW71428.1 integrase family protein [Vibrio mediterranei]
MLSDSTLKKLHRKPQSKQLTLTDRDGLYCRISKTGSVSFFMRYQFDGKADAVTLGRYPSMSLKNARDKNIELRAALEQGINPKVKKKIDVEQNTYALTLNELVDLWYEKEAKATFKVHENVYAQFKNHLLPLLGSIPAKDITTPMFFDAFESIRDKSPTVILSLLPNARNAYALAVRRRLLENNPLVGITAKRDFQVRPGETKRVLNDEELILLLTYLDQTQKQHYKKNTLIFLGLFFGCRMSELRLAEKKHFDFFKMIWTVPPKNHKTGKQTKSPLMRPIIPEVREKIEFLMGVSNSKKYLVTSQRGVEPPVQSFWGDWPEQINKWLVLNDYPEISHWSIHDLRRTMRTNISKFTDPHIGEVMIGHSLKGTWRIYDRENYLDEQKDAYAKWFKKLDRLKRGETNVTPLNTFSAAQD